MGLSHLLFKGSQCEREMSTALMAANPKAGDQAFPLHH